MAGLNRERNRRPDSAATRRLTRDAWPQRCRRSTASDRRISCAQAACDIDGGEMSERSGAQAISCRAERFAVHRSRRREVASCTLLSRRRRSIGLAR